MLRKSTMAAVVAVIGFSGTAMAQHDMKDSGQEHGNTAVTIQGRLIDLGCIKMGITGGDNHAQCAVICAEKGLPVGLKAAEGDAIYTVMLPSPKLTTYMQREVRITGKVYNTSLLAPERMEVRDGETWKLVVLPKAM